MKEYYGTKKIKAKPEPREDVNGNDRIDGCSVRYHDGYESWSPKEAFEAAYRESGRMNFGHALEALVEVRTNAQTDVARATFGDMVPYRAYFALKAVDNDIAFWVPSISDCLAKDWYVVE